MPTPFIEPLFLTACSDDFSRLHAVLGNTPGYNQSDAANLLQAKTDSEAIETFLREFRNAPLTYRSYLKEIERLSLWCVHVAKITISGLKREHLLQYREFLTKPEPVEIWCGPKRPKLLSDGSINAEWRAFVAGLSGPTIRKTISIMDSFFNYLVQNNYFAGNPMAVDKRKKGKKSNSTNRWLERDEILATLNALDTYKNSHPKMHFEVVRAKYIILTLFYTGLRLAELTHHHMGHFTLIENEWYLKVVGKGEKPRNIVVVDEYLDILAAFRKELELSPFPAYGETVPLIPAVNKRSPITDNRVGQILRWAFDIGATDLEVAALSDTDNAMTLQHKASKLRKASAHWLRHSYGTYLVKSGCAIEKVKELMGHSDISTTMIYVHIAKNDLHEAARGLSLTMG